MSRLRQQILTSRWRFWTIRRQNSRLTEIVWHLVFFNLYCNLLAFSQSTDIEYILYLNNNLFKFEYSYQVILYSFAIYLSQLLPYIWGSSDQ